MSESVFLAFVLAVVLAWGASVTGIVLVVALVSPVLAALAGLGLVYATLLTMARLDGRGRRATQR